MDDLPEVKIGEPSCDFLILGHSAASNAVGRALSMAMVADRVGRATVMAFGSGPTWAGAGQFPNKVIPLGFDWKKQLDQYFSERLANGSSPRIQVVWVSKGLRPLAKCVRWINRAHPEAVIILDLDDDDVGLAQGYRGQSVRNRVTLHRGRPGHPGSIARAQGSIAGIADGLTFSSNALKNSFPAAWTPAVRIPHVRSDGDDWRPSAPPDSGNIRIGLFGTIRPHKGGDLLVGLIESEPRFSAVVFEGSGLQFPQDIASQVLEIPPTTPLTEAYELVDVALIAMDTASHGATLQLPAKLVDAMKAGIPIVATPTPPILEIAGPVIRQIKPGDSIGAIARLIENAALNADRWSVRRAFKATLTPDAAAYKLRELVQIALLNKHAGKKQSER